MQLSHSFRLIKRKYNDLAKYKNSKKQVRYQKQKILPLYY